MIRTQELTLVIPGSLLGLNVPTARWIREIAKTADQEKLHVFIHMWNFWENVSYLNDFKEFFFEHDNVVIHAEVEDYNSKESFNVQQQFFKQLVGSYTDVIPHTVGKRVWYWYSLCKALQKVKEHNEDAFVQCIYPNSLPIQMLGEKGNERFPDYTTTWHTSVKQVKKICGTPGYARAKLTDLLYTDHSTTLLIKEQFLAGSIEVLSKLLENFDILALMAVQGEMYTKYRVEAKVGKPKNSDVLMSMIDNTKIFPNEASVFMHNLYNKNLDFNKNFILHYSPLMKMNIVQNPWFSIAEDYIQVKSPWKHLPREPKRSLQLFWTMSYQKKSDRLKDNTVDFIRKNKK
jgi:hypothetical protein